LSKHDYAQLKADIARRGVLVSIEVDETGAILDGHHRHKIATELGLKFPTTVRRGLSEAEKYLHAVSLNVSRRHLTDGQKVLVGMAVEPYIAAAARARQVSALKRGARLPSPAIAGSGETADEVARTVGLGSGDTYSRGRRVVQRIRQVSPSLLRSVRLGELGLRDARRELVELHREQRRSNIDADAAALPKGRFDCVVVDPPWRYDTRSDPSARGVVSYPTMTVEELMALDVGGLAADDAILWCWTTNAHMRKVYRLLDAWGFQEKTILTWVKPSVGLGKWLRGQTEHCVVAVRGLPTVRLTNQSTVLIAPRRDHSQKPEEFYQLVEKLCPGRKAELFARHRRKGWATAGNQLTNGAGR
jgi:N6-adenosine-specific RNA methylase IME4